MNTPMAREANKRAVRFVMCIVRQRDNTLHDSVDNDTHGWLSYLSQYQYASSAPDSFIIIVNRAVVYGHCCKNSWETG